jgi:molecular chaperone HscB
MTTNTDIGLCIGCGRATTEQLTCPGCGVVQSGSSEPDHFALFGLPRRLAIDLADLERRYYELSRHLHPDLFHDRSPAEQAASLRATALVNSAYRTLKDPVRRALYWLGLHGESLGRDNERVPAELASLVFEVQEKLDELRADRRAGCSNGTEAELRAIHGALRARLRASEERLDTSFGREDAAGADALAETKSVLSELHYLRTLLRDVEKELEPEWTA